MAASRVGRILHRYLLIPLLLYLPHYSHGNQHTKVGIMHYGNYESLGISCERDEIIMISSETLGYTTDEKCEPLDMCSVPYTLAKWYCRGKSSCAGIPVERRPLHKRTCGSDFTNCLRVEYHCVRRLQLVSVCGNHNIQTTQLYLTSPSFPDMYPPSQDCACRMEQVEPNLPHNANQNKALSSDLLRLKSVFFLLKATRPCHDWVSVKTDERAWGVRCGYNPKESVFKGNKEIEVKFHSDEHNQEMGFWMELSAENNAPFHLKCGKYINSDNPNRGNSRRIQSNRYRNRLINRQRWMKQKFAKQGPSGSDKVQTENQPDNINRNAFNPKRGFRVRNSFVPRIPKLRANAISSEYVKLNAMSNADSNDNKHKSTKRLKYHEIGSTPSSPDVESKKLKPTEQASIFAPQNKIFEKTQVEPTLGIQYKDGDLNIMEYKPIDAKELLNGTNDDGRINLDNDQHSSNTVMPNLKGQMKDNLYSNQEESYEKTMVTNNQTHEAASEDMHVGQSLNEPMNITNIFTSKPHSQPTTPYMINMDNIKKVTPANPMEYQQLDADRKVNETAQMEFQQLNANKQLNETKRNNVTTTTTVSHQPNMNEHLTKATPKTRTVYKSTIQDDYVSTLGPYRGRSYVEGKESKQMTTKPESPPETTVIEATTEDTIAFMERLSTTDNQISDKFEPSLKGSVVDIPKAQTADFNFVPSNIEAKEGPIETGENIYLESPSKEMEHSDNDKIHMIQSNDKESIHIDSDEFQSGFLDPREVYHILSTPKDTSVKAQYTTDATLFHHNKEMNQYKSWNHNSMEQQNQHGEFTQNKLFGHRNEQNPLSTGEFISYESGYNSEDGIQPNNGFLENTKRPNNVEYQPLRESHAVRHEAETETKLENETGTETKTETETKIESGNREGHSKHPSSGRKPAWELRIHKTTPRTIPMHYYPRSYQNHNLNQALNAKGNMNQYEPSENRIPAYAIPNETDEPSQKEEMITFTTKHMSLTEQENAETDQAVYSTMKMQPSTSGNALTESNKDTEFRGTTQSEFEFWYNLYSDTKRLDESKFMSNEGSMDSSENLAKAVYVPSHEINKKSEYQTAQNSGNSISVQDTSNQDIFISHEPVALTNNDHKQNHNDFNIHQQTDDITNQMYKEDVIDTNIARGRPEAKEGPEEPNFHDFENNFAHNLGNSGEGTLPKFVTIGDVDSNIEVTTETIYKSNEMVNSNEVPATVYATRNYIEPPSNVNEPFEFDNNAFSSNSRSEETLQRAKPDIYDNVSYRPYKPSNYKLSNNQAGPLTGSPNQSPGSMENGFKEQTYRNPVVSQIINNGNFEHVSDAHKYQHMLPKGIQPQPEKYLPYPRKSQNQQYSREDFRKLAQSLAQSERHLTGKEKPEPSTPISHEMVNTFSDPKPMISSLPHAPTTMVKSVFESMRPRRPTVNTISRDIASGKENIEVEHNSNVSSKESKEVQSSITNSKDLGHDSALGNDHSKQVESGSHENWQASTDVPNDQYPFLSLYPEYASYEQQNKQITVQLQNPDDKYQSNEQVIEKEASEDKYPFLSLYPQYANFETKDGQEPIVSAEDMTAEAAWLEQSGFRTQNLGGDSSNHDFRRENGANLKPSLERGGSLTSTATIQNGIQTPTSSIESNEQHAGLIVNQNRKETPVESKLHLSRTTPKSRWVDLYQESIQERQNENNIPDSTITNPYIETKNQSSSEMYNNNKIFQQQQRQQQQQQQQQQEQQPYQRPLSNPLNATSDEPSNQAIRYDSESLSKMVRPGDAKEGSESSLPVSPKVAVEWNEAKLTDNSGTRENQILNAKSYGNDVRPNDDVPFHGNEPGNNKVNEKFNWIRPNHDNNEIQSDTKIKSSTKEDQTHEHHNFHHGVIFNHEDTRSDPPIPDVNEDPNNANHNVTLTTFYVTIERLTTGEAEYEPTTPDVDREASTPANMKLGTSLTPDLNRLSTENYQAESDDVDLHMNTRDQTDYWLYGYTTEAPVNPYTEGEPEEDVTMGEEIANVKYVRDEDSKMLKTVDKNMFIRNEQEAHEDAVVDMDGSQPEIEHQYIESFELTTKAVQTQIENDDDTSNNTEDAVQIVKLKDGNGALKASKIPKIDLQNDSKLKNLLNMIKPQPTPPTTQGRSNKMTTSSFTTNQNRAGLRLTQQAKDVTLNPKSTSHDTTDVTQSPYMNYYNYGDENHSSDFSNPYMDYMTTPETTADDSYLMDNLSELYDLLTELENELENENSTDYENQYAPYTDYSNIGNGKQANIEGKEGQLGSYEAFGINDGFDHQTHNAPDPDKLPDYVDPQDAISNANEYNRDHWWNSYWQDKRRDNMNAQEGFPVQSPQEQNSTHEGWGFPMPFIPNESQISPTDPPLNPGEFSMADANGPFRIHDQPIDSPLDINNINNPVQPISNPQIEWEKAQIGENNAVEWNNPMDSAQKMNNDPKVEQNRLHIQDDRMRHDGPIRSPFQEHDEPRFGNHDPNINPESMLDERRKWEDEYFGYKEPGGKRERTEHNQRNNDNRENDKQTELKDVNDILYPNYGENSVLKHPDHNIHDINHGNLERMHTHERPLDPNGKGQRDNHNRKDSIHENKPRSQLEMDPFPEHTGSAENLHTGFEIDRGFLHAPNFDLPLQPFPQDYNREKEYLETNLSKSKEKRPNFDNFVEVHGKPSPDLIDIVSDTIDQGLSQPQLVNDNKIWINRFPNWNDKQQEKKDSHEKREKENTKMEHERGFYGPPTDPSMIRHPGDKSIAMENRGRDINADTAKSKSMDDNKPKPYSNSPFQRHYTDSWQNNQIKKPQQDGIMILGDVESDKKDRDTNWQNKDTKEGDQRRLGEREPQRVQWSPNNNNLWANHPLDHEVKHVNENRETLFKNNRLQKPDSNKDRNDPRRQDQHIRDRERERGKEVVQNLANWVERESEDPKTFNIDNDIDLWREAFENFENERDRLGETNDRENQWNKEPDPLNPNPWNRSFGVDSTKGRTVKPKISNKDRFNKWRATQKDSGEAPPTKSPMFPFKLDNKDNPDRNEPRIRDGPKPEENNGRNRNRNKNPQPRRKPMRGAEKELSGVSKSQRQSVEKNKRRTTKSYDGRRVTKKPALVKDNKLENQVSKGRIGIESNESTVNKANGGKTRQSTARPKPNIKPLDTSTKPTKSDNIEDILRASQDGLMEIDPSLYGRVRKMWETNLQRTPTPQIQTTESELEYSEMAAISEQQDEKKKSNKDTLWVLLVIAVIGWIVFMVLIGLLIYYKRDRMCYKKFGRRSPYTSSYASSMPKHLMFPDLHSPLCSLSHPQISSSEHSPSIPYSTNSSDSLLALSSANNQHLARNQSKPSSHRAQVHAVNLGDNGSFGALSLHSGADSMFERPLPPVPDHKKGEGKRGGETSEEQNQNGGHTRTPSSFCPEMMFGASTSKNDENMAVQANTGISEKDLILLDKQVTKTVHDTFRSNKSHYQSLNTIRSRKAKSRGGTPETKRNENTNNEDEIFSASMHHLETSFDNIQKEADSRIQAGNAWVFTNQHLSKDDQQLVVGHINIRSPRPEHKKPNMNLSSFVNQTDSPNKTSSPNQSHFKPKLNTDKHPMISIDDQTPGGIHDPTGFGATPYAHKAPPHNYPQLSTPFTGRKPNKPVRVDLIRGQPNPNAPNKGGAGKEQKRLNRTDGGHPRSNKPVSTSMSIDADNSTDSNSMDAIYQSLTQIANKYGAQAQQQQADPKQLSPSSSNISTVSSPKPKKASSPSPQSHSPAPSTVSIAGPPVPPHPPKAASVSPMVKDSKGHHVRQYSGPMKTDKHVGPLYQNTQHLRNNNVIAVSPPKLPMDERDPSKMVASSPKKITLSINADSDKQRDTQKGGTAQPNAKPPGHRSSPGVKTKTSQQSQTRIKMVPQSPVASAKARPAGVHGSPKSKKNKSGSYDFISKLPADIQEVSETSPHNSDKEHYGQEYDNVVLQDVRSIPGDKKALVEPDRSPKETRVSDQRRGASPKQKPARKKGPRSPNGHKKKSQPPQQPREKSQFAQASMMLMNTVPDLQRQQFIQQQRHHTQEQQQQQYQQKQQQMQQQQSPKPEIIPTHPPTPPPFDEYLLQAPPQRGTDSDDMTPMFPFNPNMRNSARDQAQRLLNTLSKKPGSSAERIRKIIPEQASLFNEKVKPELNRILNERNVKRDSVNV